jgi:hypothetical protein
MDYNNKKLFVTILDKFLLDKKFKKEALSWKKQINNYWILLNLQKSQFGNYFYFNIGITFEDLSKLKIIPTYKWFLLTRYESAINLSNKEILELFSYNIEEERIRLNLNKIEKNLLKILELIEKFKDTKFIIQKEGKIRDEFNPSCFDIEKLKEILKDA